MATPAAATSTTLPRSEITPWSGLDASPGGATSLGTEASPDAGTGLSPLFVRDPSPGGRHQDPVEASPFSQRGFDGDGIFSPVMAREAVSSFVRRSGLPAPLAEDREAYLVALREALTKADVMREMAYEAIIKEESIGIQEIKELQQWDKERILARERRTYTTIPFDVRFFRIQRQIEEMLLRGEDPTKIVVSERPFYEVRPEKVRVGLKIYGLPRQTEALSKAIEEKQGDVQLLEMDIGGKFVVPVMGSVLRGSLEGQFYADDVSCTARVEVLYKAAQNFLVGILNNQEIRSVQVSYREEADDSLSREGHPGFFGRVLFVYPALVRVGKKILPFNDVAGLRNDYGQLPAPLQLLTVIASEPCLYQMYFKRENMMITRTIGEQVVYRGVKHTTTATHRWFTLQGEEILTKKIRSFRISKNARDYGEIVECYIGGIRQKEVMQLEWGASARVKMIHQELD